ncbi:MAG: [protein-PII] uridylyltransferase [Acidimicrobiales bacterium]|nr:[protein-PII] uridylyltransferase [Acidimicrobiales bacterium]
MPIDAFTSNTYDGAEFKGLDYCRARSAAADVWLRRLFYDATQEDSNKVALVAVGGFGRGMLWPQSDLDLVLFHSKRRDIADIAERLWYPIWDRNLKLGHAVLTPREAAKLASAELERSTAFSAMRLIAGDPAVLDNVEHAMSRVRAKRSAAQMRELGKSVEQRHESYGDVAFLLEPDLKEGRGGLRDVDALRWAEAMTPGFAAELLGGLDAPVELLSAVRVELHRTTGRSSNHLNLDEQDAIAERMGMGSGLELMKEVSLAARRIAWNSDEAWRRWRRSEREAAAPNRDRDELISDDVLIRNGALDLTGTANVVTRPHVLLELAVEAAQRSMPIDRGTLARLQQECPPLDDHWDEHSRTLLADLFLAGEVALSVIEDLDMFDLVRRILPEWETVRSLPQRNVLHTFTVDRHLCESAVNASALADQVARPDLLVVGALLHDIGKGYPGDHTEVGMDVIQGIGDRMGYPIDDTAVLVDLCRHHLLLSDVAVRRDLGDEGTIRSVAAAVDSSEFLRLLAALTEADSVATGPAVWGGWKEQLLADLVERTDSMLKGEPVAESRRNWPGSDVQELMAARTRTIEHRGNRITVVTENQPGVFSRLAGVMVMSGLDVVSAEALSDGAMAACSFLVSSGGDDRIDWDTVVPMIDRALDGRLAIAARVARRAEQLNKYRRRLSAIPPTTSLRVDNDISEVSSVVDVHAPDSAGLLYRVTRAMVDLRLDVGKATVQTLGPQAVDSFYVTDSFGEKLTDEMLTELEMAILHAIELAP